jgi:hypothetical protein
MNGLSKREVLSSDEWDFRGISKPEIWICWSYEFAREAVRMYPTLLRPTTEWRAGAPKSFPECLEYLRQRPFTPIGGWLGLLSPEWPDRPYLTIEADERMSRSDQIRKYYATLPASPIAAFLQNPLIPVKSRVDWDLIIPMLEDQLNRSPDKMSIPTATVGEGPSITDCLGYYDLYETIGAYYKAEDKAMTITRKYFVSMFYDKK